MEHSPHNEKNPEPEIEIIDPEESTMTFRNSRDKITKIVRYRKDGTREEQEYDPKTGKPKGAPTIRLPEQTPEALERKKDAEETLRMLKEKENDAA